MLRCGMSTGFTRNRLSRNSHDIIAKRSGNNMIFHVVLEDDEDGWVVAECPSLPGCVSQGKTRDEAVENIKEAISAWLWAEDQKALASMAPPQASQAILVTV